MEWKTTFWMDFTIADAFGHDAVRDTFDRAFEEWRDDYVYLTELVIVLNWKIWQHYDNGNEQLSRLYDELWREADGFAFDTLKDDELVYFCKMTD